MRLLVLATSYPDNFGEISLNYVHVRNVYYRKCGFDVVVLNFRAPSCYVKDGIKVITLNEYWHNYSSQVFDILVCHAANIRFHYRFLKKEGKRFRRIVFFYHGHEVMHLNDYPKEYTYAQKQHRNIKVLIPLYDKIKLAIWRHYITSNIEKVELVFVSEWMRDTFLKNVKLSKDVLANKKLHIIYNSVSHKYEINSWNKESPKKYDYVTIRGGIDTSKFAIDLVNDLAIANPEAKFLIVGKGEFFDYYKKASNIVRIEHYMNQDEIIEVLNESKCALMPTRLDAQGVMACEMATFGIPVITSDIPVCRYVFSGFPNVAYINNNDKNAKLIDVLSTISLPHEKNTRFFERETVQKEIDLFERICNTLE